jgi:flavin-dependent dehydrogenase
MIERSHAAVNVHASPDGGRGGWSEPAPHVVVCDGATGRGARLAGLKPAHTRAIALEARVPHVWGAGHPELRADTIHLEYGAVRNGYAWVFPNRDQVNIGAGFFRDANDTPGAAVRGILTAAMRELSSSLGIADRWDRTEVYAHPLPIWAGRNQLHTTDGRVMLAGDSAALVDPLFGDGILNAVRSGRIAAECILAGRPESYTHRINAEIGAELEAAARLARVFYRLPRECYRLVVCRHGATAIAARLLCGVLSYRQVAPRALKRLSRALVSG